MSKSNTKPMTFREIIARWETMADLAEGLNEKYPTVQAWHNRDSIPGEYHLRVAALAKRCGFKDLTLEVLALAAENRGRCIGPNKLPRDGARHVAAG